MKKILFSLLSVIIAASFAVTPVLADAPAGPLTDRGADPPAGRSAW